MLQHGQNLAVLVDPHVLYAIVSTVLAILSKSRVCNLIAVNLIIEREIFTEKRKLV